MTASRRFWRVGAAGLVATIAACSAAQTHLAPPCEGTCEDLVRIDSGASGIDADAVEAAPKDAGSDTADVSPRPPIRVLFVGNSYTSVNDLPSVVRAIGAATPGGAVEVESVTKDGATLSQHWSTMGPAGPRERIAAGKFDAVVMQAQSVEPMYSSEEFHEYAQRFGGALHDAGSRGIWFATWARRIGDVIYSSGGLDPASMSKELEFRYSFAAKGKGDLVARVGAAWQLSLAELPAVVLHAEDGSHPTAAGTLLAGCVILQALTGQTPRAPEPPPPGVSSATAQALCAIAPRVHCPEGKAFCNGVCADLTNDAQHCGACGKACAGEDPCRAGVCGCDAGLRGCSEQCVDVLTDAWNCGTCGVRCADGKACKAGSCVCQHNRAPPITIGQLAALRPTCASFDAAGSPDCNRAAHEYCEARECFNSGFGPPSGHAPAPSAVMCVAGDVRATTYTALKAFVPACDGTVERAGQSCTTAISRYCASIGAVSGFGPIASLGDDLAVTCVSNATVVPTTVAALKGFASRCTPDPVTCSVASWNFCQSAGYPGGFGPIEVSGTDTSVVCLDF